MAIGLDEPTAGRLANPASHTMRGSWPELSGGSLRATALGVVRHGTSAPSS